MTIGPKGQVVDYSGVLVCVACGGGGERGRCLHARAAVLADRVVDLDPPVDDDAGFGDGMELFAVGSLAGQGQLDLCW